MSQSHAKPGLQIESKRARAAEVAGSEADSAASEDRSVRQRTDSLAPLPAASSAASSASSSSAASHAFTAIRLSLMRLAVVERQLVMQALDITSLARLASTCKQLQAEALHREAGKFITSVPGLDSPAAIKSPHPAHACPLFRMHAPVTLRIFRFAVAEHEPLMVKASGFSRITQLRIEEDGQWTEPMALQLLAQPWIQSVTKLELSSAPLWLQPAVQHALFALPQLAFIRLTLSVKTEALLLESALSQAAKLTSADIHLHGTLDAGLVRALQVAPSLTTLQLRSFGMCSQAPPLGQLVWCAPQTVTDLTLALYSLEPVRTPQSTLRDMFLRLPQLRTLCTEWYMEIAPLLQGLLDAGVDALPNLRRLEFQDGSIDGLDPSLVARFLATFPATTIEFWSKDFRTTPDGPHAQLIEWFSDWQRVEVDEDDEEWE